MKNKYISLLLGLVLFIPQFCISSEEDDIAAIRQAADTWIEFYSAGDLDRMMTLYMPDALVALHGQPAMRGIDTIRAFFQPGMGKSEVDFKIDISEIQIHGDTAHLVSKYWFTAVSKADGSVYKDAGRSVLIYKRDTDGKWKIYLDIDQATPDVDWES